MAFVSAFYISKSSSWLHCYISIVSLYSNEKPTAATMKALKFTKPKLSQDGTNVKRGLLMGKVEIKMYEGIFGGYEDQRTSNFSSSFTATAVDFNQTGLVKKKSLRSGEGDTVESIEATARQPIYNRGALLDVVTLNYCTALGLIEVGVLEKPDMWTHQRMKRPHKPDQGGPRVKPTTIADPGAANPQIVDLFTPQHYHQPPAAQYPPAVQYPPTVQYQQQMPLQQNYHQPPQQNYQQQYQQQYRQQYQQQHQQQYQQQYHQPYPQQYQHPPPAIYQQYQQVAHPPGTVHSMYQHQP
jgi:hypothetical protein